MAFKINDSNEALSEINTTPLVDVMLVLMVIFLITAPVLTSSIKLELPKEKAGSGIEKKPITISINEAGELFFGNNQISKPELEAKLKTIYAENPKQQIYIRADKNTKYSEVAYFLSVSSKIGLTNVGFVLQK